MCSNLVLLVIWTLEKINSLATKITLAFLSSFAALHTKLVVSMRMLDM